MWRRIATTLLIGNFLLGRSFAHLGIPPLHVFVGEVALGAFLILGPRAGGHRWPWVAMHQPELQNFLKVFLLFLAFGVVEVIRGIHAGYPMLSAVRDLSVNYYPIFFFLGLWVGAEDRSYLKKLMRLAAWANGIYGLLFILVLSQLPLYIASGSQAVDSFNPVPIFGQPSFTAVILLGLLSFEKDLSRVFVPLVLNAFVLIGMLIRAEWFAFALGLLLWLWFTRNLKRAALCGGILVGILAFMYFVNFSLEGPQTRGGTISVGDIVGRVIAPMNPDLAKDYTSDEHQFGATAAWRTLFWIEIWSSVHENKTRALLGYGYGFPLNDLFPDIVDESTRSPHDTFFYFLGFSGWAGVAIFGLFQAMLARLLWAAYKATGQPYGIIFWVTIMGFSIFTPFFETPYGAIPFFLVTGCACAPLLSPSRAAAPATVPSRKVVPRPARVRTIDAFPSHVGLEGGK